MRCLISSLSKRYIHIVLLLCLWHSIIDKKLIPYFGKKRMSDIKPKDIIAWQNEMMNYRDEHGKPYSPVYLKTLHNQLILFGTVCKNIFLQ